MQKEFAVPLAGLIFALLIGATIIVVGIFTAPLWVRIAKLAKTWVKKMLDQAQANWNKPVSDKKETVDTTTSRFNQSEKGQGATLYIIILVAVVAVIGFIVFVTCYRRVDPGSIGLVIDYRQTNPDGSPSITKAQTGTFFFVDPTWQRMIVYPISQQTLTMVAATKEGRIQGDDSTLCQDKNGVQNRIDSRTMYRVNPQKAGDLYLLRPGMSLISPGEDDIEFQIVRPQVISAISKGCSQFTYAEITGEKKAQLEAVINSILADGLAKNNIVLDTFMLGQVIPPDAQKKALDDVAIAEQQAKKAFYQKQEQENLAAGRVAAAEGDKQVAILQAQGQAESIRIVQEQLNKSPNYIAYLYAYKFNGVGPSTLVLANGETSLSTLVPYGPTK